MPYKFGPKIQFEPSLALTFKELKSKFEGKCVEIGPEASLLFGNDALDNLNQNWLINTTAIARRKFNFFDHAEEELIVFEHTNEKDDEIYLIRGYKPKRVT